MSLGSSGDAKGGSAGVGGKTSAEPDAMRGERPAGEMLYTDFVIKLEAAMAKGESVNEPWVRWMVPLHLQYHRYASLQARRQKQLTPSEGREVLAARVRLRRVSEALDELLSVLRRRLDDSWFQNNMRKLRKEAMARSSDSHSYHDAVKAAATTAIDAKNRKKGILGGLRTARLWARKAVMREEAIERWDLVRRAVPVVVAEGVAWWEREPPPPRRGRFQIDSAKAMQDVERGFGRVVSDARAAARAAAEHPARAAAGGAVALFAALVGARAKRRRGRLTLETISQEMATTGREMSKMAKAAQEELTHVIEDAGRAVDRAVHPHQAPRPPHEQHAASKPNKPPARVRPPKRSADPTAAETDPDPEPTPARGMMRRRRAPANEAEARHEPSSSATTDAKAKESAKTSAAAMAKEKEKAKAAATSPTSSSPPDPSTTTAAAPANPSPASAKATPTPATSSPTEAATKDGK